MRWIKAIAVCALAAVLLPAVIRQAAPLPSLENRSQSLAYPDTAATPLGRAIGPIAAAHPRLTGLYPLPDPLEAFAARALLARQATRSIDAQYYIWHGDLAGTLLFDELRRAADRGVRVRLLLDDNNTAMLDPAIAALDAHPNIEVRLFNPFTIRKPRLIGFLTDFSRLNRRMHNKSFTVDNQATIVGGRNVGDEYFAAGDGALFVDLDVLAVGAVVPEVSRGFDRYWASASAYPASRIVPSCPAACSNTLVERASAITRAPGARSYVAASNRVELVDELLRGVLPLLWAPVRMISDDPAKGLGRAAPSDLLFPQLTASMGEPRQRLILVSGYFVPGKEGTRALADVAKRGVQVTILTNSFDATDVPIVHAGYARWRKALLASGIRIFELRRYGADGPRPRREVTGLGSSGSPLEGAGAALHAKTFAVDGQRVFVGSFNFDPRSAELNTEMGFVISSSALAERMQQAFGRLAPARAYEVRLSRQGNLYWLERQGGREVRHDTEPNTTAWQRAFVHLLALMEIDWLL